MSEKYYKNSKGKRLARCTGVINILGYNKDALVAWAKRLGQEAQAVSDRALSIGTLTHALIEAHIKGTEVDMSEYDIDTMLQAQSGFESYKKWESVVQPEYIASEYRILSERHPWGGTADFLCRIKEEHIPEELRVGKEVYTILGDFKTSKGVYEDHCIQCAAYLNGISEMTGYDDEIVGKLEEYNETKIIRDIQIDNVLIIHIPKDVPVGEEVKVTPYWLDDVALRHSWKAFCCALELKEIRKHLKPMEVSNGCVQEGN